MCCKKKKSRLTESLALLTDIRKPRELRLTPAPATAVYEWLPLAAARPWDTHAEQLRLQV